MRIAHVYGSECRRWLRDAVKQISQKMCNFKLVKHNVILVIISIRGFVQKFENFVSVKCRPFLLEGRLRFFYTDYSYLTNVFRLT
jgi:hypothetical protein